MYHANVTKPTKVNIECFGHINIRIPPIHILVQNMADIMHVSAPLLYLTDFLQNKGHAITYDKMIQIYLGNIRAIAKDQHEQLFRLYLSMKNKQKEKHNAE